MKIDGNEKCTRSVERKRQVYEWKRFPFTCLETFAAKIRNNETISVEHGNTLSAQVFFAGINLLVRSRSLKRATEQCQAIVSFSRNEQLLEPTRREPSVNIYTFFFFFLATRSGLKENCGKRCKYDSMHPKKKKNMEINLGIQRKNFANLF